MKVGRAVRRAVLLVMVADAATFTLAQWLGVSSVGEFSPHGFALTLLTILFAAAVMWRRWRTSAALGGVIFAATVFLGGAQGSETWAIAVAAITLSLGRCRPRVYAALAAVLAFAVVSDVLAHDGHTWAWSSASSVLELVLCVLLGRAIRVALAALRRARLRVRQAQVRFARVRTDELAGLAREMETVVMRGLLRVRELTAGREFAPLDALRRDATRVETVNQELLAELRDLVDTLRRDVDPAVTPPGDTNTRARITRGVRVGAAVLAGLALLVLVASALPEWPHPGADPATVIALTGLCFLGAAAGPRAGAAALGVAILFAVAVGQAGVSAQLVALVYVCLVATIVGYSGRRFFHAYAETRRELRATAAENVRRRIADHRAVARELHDVVGHQLSVASLRLMEVSMSNEAERWRDVFADIHRLTESAQRDLQALLHSLRHPDVNAPEPAPLVRPTTAALTVSQTLTQQGFRPVFRISSEVDHLDESTQRTCTRIIQEASTNVLRYATPGSVCELSVDVGPDEVVLHVTNPVPARRHTSRLSQGWGLRGIAERVDLLGGEFSAGNEDGLWVLRTRLTRRPQPDGVAAA